MLQTCEYCGLQMDHKRLPRHVKVCFKNPNNFFSEEPIFLDNPEIIEKLKNQPDRLQNKQKIRYVCKTCGREILLKRFSTFESLETCKYCKTEKANLEKYGTKTPAESEIVKQRMKETFSKRTFEEIERSNSKRKQTCLEKYGVEAVALDEKIGKTQRESLINKSEEEKKEILEKRKNTMLKKYGVNYALQSGEIKEKSKNTFLNHYGCSNVFQTEEFKEKRAITCKEKYGDEFPIRTLKIKEKVRKTMIEKYGSYNFRNIEKTKETWLKNYGISHPPIFKYSYMGQLFDSSWELAVWIWANDMHKNIKREPLEIEFEYKGSKRTYFPDFEIDGELIEIKGPQFFKEGKLVNPYDETQNGLYQKKYEVALERGVKFWSGEEMGPVLEYIEKKYTTDFLNLFKKDLPFPYPKLIKKGDNDIIRYFHRSIYSASKKGKLSPLRAWEDKNLILKSALNRLKYVGKCDPESVLKGFSVASIAPRISIFRPALAETLIKKYLTDSDLIIDPFSGFSGRLLGSFNCGKQYLGWDINEDHVRESNEIIKFKNAEKNCSVGVQNLILSNTFNWSSKRASLFTCPPYGGKEHWNENNDEVEKSCDEWIDLCLEKHKGCEKYLFVVDETEKYKDKIVDKIENKSHFGINWEYVVLIEN